MAEARGRAEWAQTSSMLALIANVNRDPKKRRAFKAEDFSPYRPEKGAKAPKADLSVLRDVFVKPKRRKPQRYRGTEEKKP